MYTTRYATGLIVCLVALAILPAAACAEEETGGRYAMSPTEDGVVRLDKQTGAMSLCRKRDDADDAWACESMDDSQRVLADENDKLRAENKSLKDQVQHLEETLGLGENQSDAPSPGAKLTLPSEADVDKAFDYFERMLDKLHERMKKLEEKHADKPEMSL